MKAGSTSEEYYIHWGGWHSTGVAFTLLTPGSILSVPEDLFISEIYSLDAAQIYRQHCTV